MYTVVFPLRSNPRTTDHKVLKYSLRSIQANLPHSNVVIGEGFPTWGTNMTHLEIKPGVHPWVNQGQTLTAALESDEVTDPFYWFNSDQLVLRGQDTIALHSRLIGIADYAAKLKAPKHIWYQQQFKLGMEIQAKILKEEGFEEWAKEYNTDSHHPIMLSKDRLSDTLDLIDRYKGFRGAFKAVYGRGLTPLKVQDCKIMTRDKRLPQWEFVSFCTTSWSGISGREARFMFEEPSPYER